MDRFTALFRICATARLFIDHMLPDLDAGIFLDTDILLMDDIKVRQFQWRNEVNWVIIIIMTGIRIMLQLYCSCTFRIEH